MSLFVHIVKNAALSILQCGCYRGQHWKKYRQPRQQQQRQQVTGGGAALPAHTVFRKQVVLCFTDRWAVNISIKISEKRIFVTTRLPSPPHAWKSPMLLVEQRHKKKTNAGNKKQSRPSPSLKSIYFAPFEIKPKPASLVRTYSEKVSHVRMVSTNRFKLRTSHALPSFHESEAAARDLHEERLRRSQAVCCEVAAAAGLDL